MALWNNRSSKSGTFGKTLWVESAGLWLSLIAADSQGRQSSSSRSGFLNQTRDSGPEKYLCRLETLMERDECSHAAAGRFRLLTPLSS